MTLGLYFTIGFVWGVFCLVYRIVKNKVIDCCKTKTGNLIGEVFCLIFSTLAWPIEALIFFLSGLIIVVFKLLGKEIKGEE
jgi:hypothetical protein